MALVSGITKGQATVASLIFSSDEVETLKAKLLKLTEATIIVRSPERDENGRCKYVEMPDVGIQLAATVKALEFAVGKPTQKIMDATPARPPGMLATAGDITRMLGKNPELLGKIVEMAKFAQAMQVQEVASEPAKSS